MIVIYLFPFFIYISIFVVNIIIKKNKGKVPTNFSTFIIMFVNPLSFSILRSEHIFTSLVTYHLPVFHRLEHPQRTVRYLQQTLENSGWEAPSRNRPFSHCTHRWRWMAWVAANVRRNNISLVFHWCLIIKDLHFKPGTTCNMRWTMKHMYM